MTALRMFRLCPSFRCLWLGAMLQLVSGCATLDTFEQVAGYDNVGPRPRAIQLRGAVLLKRGGLVLCSEPLGHFPERNWLLHIREVPREQAPMQASAPQGATILPWNAWVSWQVELYRTSRPTIEREDFEACVAADSSVSVARLPILGPGESPSPGVPAVLLLGPALRFDAPPGMPQVVLLHLPPGTLEGSAATSPARIEVGFAPEPRRRPNPLYLLLLPPSLFIDAFIVAGLVIAVPLTLLDAAYEPPR